MSLCFVCVSDHSVACVGNLEFAREVSCSSGE